MPSLVAAKISYNTVTNSGPNLHSLMPTRRSSDTELLDLKPAPPILPFTVTSRCSSQHRLETLTSPHEQNCSSSCECFCRCQPSPAQYLGSYVFYLENHDVCFALMETGSLLHVPETGMTATLEKNVRVVEIICTLVRNLSPNSNSAALMSMGVKILGVVEMFYISCFCGGSKG
ncbi:hypothetical protein SO802_028096 [Lithocarpus litseifolius]|uniref:Uncharacterized protein n=1 Tax=Lithocarpus litseifolius TaxID=425828 RepID=A0AAW2BRS1_9ROSI